MKNTLLLQINVSNYDTDSYKNSMNITKEDFEHYKDIFKVVNEVSEEHPQAWNWFNRLPDKWDGSKFVDDKWLISKTFEDNFGVKMNADHIIDFYKRFTPRGGGRISNIKLFEIKEVEF